ncbi:MAG: hypothetical protein AAGC93_04395 [Cyanobacteria bacterium P01_F01_bin.53]
MFVRLTQATTITLALYMLLGLNTLQSSRATTTVDSSVETAEVLVALKEALIRR